MMGGRCVRPTERHGPTDRPAATDRPTILVRPTIMDRPTNHHGPTDRPTDQSTPHIATHALTSTPISHVVLRRHSFARPSFAFAMTNDDVDAREDDVDEDVDRGRKKARKSRWDTPSTTTTTHSTTTPWTTTAVDDACTKAIASDERGRGNWNQFGEHPIVLPDAKAIEAHVKRAASGMMTFGAIAPKVAAQQAPRSDDPEVTRAYAKYVDRTQRLTMRDFRDDRAESDRSPSPPPKYDRFGVKVNTREARMKDKLFRERDELIEWLIEHVPSGEFAPPVDWRPRKKERKLYVPEDEYPGYNFIGLILGPRGNTQKRMERETNTRIMLRGKGSVKPGAHRDHKTDYKEDEPLHVVILGETWEGVDAAAEMVGHILRPIDEEENVHKRMQLRELASINGTFVESFGACRFCGTQGHVQANCPEREAMERAAYRAPVELVTCKICGDGGHPTRDCPLAGRVDAAGEAPNDMNQEYSAFLNEIGVSKGEIHRGGSSGVPSSSLPPPPQQQSRFGEGVAPSATPFRPGDWMCEPCGYHNYASNVVCNRRGCEATRPPNVGAAQGGFGGAPHVNDAASVGVGAPQQSFRPAANFPQKPFRPGDWMCEPCGYHNFASNVMCNRRGCEAMRPSNAGIAGAGFGGAPHVNDAASVGVGAPLRRAPPPPPPIMPASLQQHMGGYMPYVHAPISMMSQMPAVPPPPPEDGSAGVPPPPPEDGSAGLPPPPAVIVVPPPPPVRVMPKPMLIKPVTAKPIATPDEPEEGEFFAGGRVIVPPPPQENSKEAEFASFMNNL